MLLQRYPVALTPHALHGCEHFRHDCHRGYRQALGKLCTGKRRRCRTLFPIPPLSVALCPAVFSDPFPPLPTSPGGDVAQFQTDTAKDSRVDGKGTTVLHYSTVVVGHPTPYLTTYLSARQAASLPAYTAKCIARRGLTYTGRVHVGGWGTGRDDAQRHMDMIALGRPGVPNDIAQGILFLCASNYTNGHCLVIDGAWSICIRPF